jgi:hypothetical protein
LNEKEIVWSIIFSVIWSMYPLYDAYSKSCVISLQWPVYGWAKREPIAWMPLPQPYKEEGE